MAVYYTNGKNNMAKGELPSCWTEACDAKSAIETIRCARDKSETDQMICWGKYPRKYGGVGVGDLRTGDERNPDSPGRTTHSNSRRSAE